MANIFETVRGQGSMNKLVKAIQSSIGLTTTLSQSGPFTFFAPTEAAFNQLSDKQQTDLFGDPEKLTKVLKFHIVPGLYTADDLLDRVFLKTLEGQRLRVWSNLYDVPEGDSERDMRSDALNYVTQSTITTATRESIEINRSHVTQADIRADNGIVHVIDKVLIPPLTML